MFGMYDDVGGPKLFISVSGGNGIVMKTHGLVRECIGNFANIGATDFALGTPPVAADGTSPALWLVADIPAHLAQAIIDMRILSSAPITLFTFPYHIPIIGFVGIFTGFTIANTAEGATIACGLIRTAIAANAEIAQFVQTHRDAYGPQVSAGQAWEIFLASISVRGIGLLISDTNTVAWRLHVDPPTNNRDHWDQLGRLHGKVEVLTALYGTAHMQRAIRCRICPGIDHPTALCPLPNLPGWLGPTLATITALEEASRQAAAKAREQFRAAANPSGSNSDGGRGQGPNNRKFPKDGKPKKGGDYKGKGKRREHDDFF
ncbi:hypothetical protein DFH06DRAFT_1314410 [Mycena polygramma]|nr:hypothetical protein DFH06DRAFT_1314410 [Mycena polygramma]